MTQAAISAHQGGSEHAPPSTYDAYRRCAASGAQYAEFDIRRTRDDVLVVCHDERSAAGPLVADLGYRDLCDRLGYSVPRVAEVMRLHSGYVQAHMRSLAQQASEMGQIVSRAATDAAKPKS